MLKIKHHQNFMPGVQKIIITVLLIFTASTSNAQQKISFGIHADPAVSWFSSDNSEIKNEGARPGFNFGLTFNRYFTPNYSFSTGISLLSAGGRLISNDTTEMEFTNIISTVNPGNSVIYRIQYLAIPIGLKLQTNQIGYLTFFTDLGIDPKVVIGGKADIPSLDISGENAISELRVFNLSYHFTAGIEYSLGGTTALLLGLNFDNNFLDITKENGDQLADKISHKIVSFRIGVNF
ncbi:MAG TPA: porin family protein [Bacteroidales bacterium]|nr:porin family protein [Bacteroidales bacterium]